jgi:plasmid stabilization system protein ParE
MPSAQRVVFVPLAEVEFEDARLWYEKQQPGLGMEFAIEVEAAIERIRQSPEMYARVSKDYRRVILKRFPYAIYYEFTGEIATVYTVFHCAQNPAKLGYRLP